MKIASSVLSAADNKDRKTVIWGPTMQKRTVPDDQVFVDIQSTWTEQERAERRLLAQLKQQWLGELLGIEAHSREIEKPNLTLEKAC